ncbi:MAG: 50S ribosomal protein L25 [Phycisphaerales bacterium]|nr:MAG: 50S ribosomal protein L25 [Phycisphaerales bacterium]
MQHETTTLIAERRERLGSRYAQRLRAGGRLPAIVYGHGETPIPVAVDRKLAVQHIERGEKVFNIEFDGRTETVLVKDLQFDHLGTEIIHADLTLVNLNERVETNVHVHLIGTPKGLKTEGALLMHPTTQITIECTVTNIPEEIDVDVSELDAHESIHASEIKLPLDTMKLVSDADAIVAQIVVKNVESTGEEATVEGQAAPEVLTEKKKDEEKD